MQICIYVKAPHALAMAQDMRSPQALAVFHSKHPDQRHAVSTGDKATHTQL